MVITCRQPILTLMAFYIYSFFDTKKIVEAANRGEVKKKLGLSNTDIANYVSLATDKDLELYNANTSSS